MLAGPRTELQLFGQSASTTPLANFLGYQCSYEARGPRGAGDRAASYHAIRPCALLTGLTVCDHRDPTHTSVRLLTPALC